MHYIWALDVVGVAAGCGVADYVWTNDGYLGSN